MNHLGLEPFSQGRAIVCTGGEYKESPFNPDEKIFGSRKYGYLGLDGRLAINGNYDLVCPFSDGLAAVTIGEIFKRSRCGYINQDGDVAIPLEFTSATPFRDGVAVVRRRGKRWRAWQHVIDTSGKVVLETEYRIEPFSEGLAAAWTGNSWGVIDVSGKIVISAQFDQIEPFRDGLAEVQRGDWYGIVNVRGEFIWGPTTEGRINRTLESKWH